jgi:hypothetical protein
MLRQTPTGPVGEAENVRAVQTARQPSLNETEVGNSLHGGR